MKKTFLLFIILPSLYVQSQSMENAIYYTVKKDIGFTSEIFEFKEQNKFNYSLFGCTGSSFGSGTYKVIRDSLYLKFSEKPFLKKDGIKFNKTSSDSLVINIRVGEKYSDYPLPGVICNLLDTEIGWQSDFDGLIFGKILKPKTPKVLRFQYIGYGRYDIEVSPDIGEITGVLKMDNVDFFEPDEEIKVKLKSNNSRRFKLELSKDTNITYRKISKNEASEIIKDRTEKNYDYYFSNN